MNIKKLKIITVSFLLLTICFFVTNMSVKSDGPGSEWYTTQVIATKAEIGWNTVRIPAICTFADGGLMVAFEARVGSDGSESDIYYVKSSDNGDTWGNPVQWIGSHPDVQGGNDDVGVVNPAFLRDGNRMYFTYTIQPTWYDFYDDEQYNFLRYSDDNGSSWSDDLTITSLNPSWVDSGTSGPGGEGHSFIQPGGLVLPNGTLMLPAFGWNCTDTRDYGFSLVSYPGDDPTTLGGWHVADGVIGQSVPQDQNEVTYAICDNGTLYSIARERRFTSYPASPPYTTVDNVSPWTAWSEDYSESWSDPRHWDYYGKTNCRADITTFSSNVMYDCYSAGNPIFHDKSRILMAQVNDTTRPSNHDISWSYDGGQTWDSKTVTGGSTGTQVGHYSDIGVLQNGTICFVAEDGTPGDYQEIYIVRFNLEWLTDSNDYFGSDVQNGDPPHVGGFNSIQGLTNNSVTNSVIYNFNWSKNDSANYYRLQMANDSTFTDVWFDERINSTTFPGDYVETGDYIEFTLPSAYRKTWNQDYYFRYADGSSA